MSENRVVHWKWKLLLGVLLVCALLYLSWSYPMSKAEGAVVDYPNYVFPEIMYHERNPAATQVPISDYVEIVVRLDVDDYNPTTGEMETFQDPEGTFKVRLYWEHSVGGGWNQYDMLNANFGGDQLPTYQYAGYIPFQDFDYGDPYDAQVLNDMGYGSDKANKGAGIIDWYVELYVPLYPEVYYTKDTHGDIFSFVDTSVAETQVDLPPPDNPLEVVLSDIGELVDALASGEFATQVGNTLLDLLSNPAFIIFASLLPVSLVGLVMFAAAGGPTWLSRKVGMTLPRFTGIFGRLSALGQKTRLTTPITRTKRKKLVRHGKKRRRKG